MLSRMRFFDFQNYGVKNQIFGVRLQPRLRAAFARMANEAGQLSRKSVE